MIDRVSQTSQISQVSPAAGSQAAQRPNAPAKSGAFGDILTQRVRENQSLAFSKHARERAEERGIQVDDQLLDQLTGSVEKAQAKGATNILAFDTTRAFIINVPNGRVITALSPEEMRENIFTNIDGAVIL